MVYGICARLGVRCFDMMLQFFPQVSFSIAAVKTS